jgi:hypothetical protein
MKQLKTHDWTEIPGIRSVDSPKTFDPRVGREFARGEVVVLKPTAEGRGCHDSFQAEVVSNEDGKLRVRVLSSFYSPSHEAPLFAKGEEMVVDDRQSVFSVTVPD